VASQPRGSDPVSVGGSSAAPVVDCPADPAAVLTPIVTDLLAEHVPAMQFLPPAATSYSCAGYVISQFAGPADTNERVEVQLFAGENAAERYTGLPDPVSDTTLPDGSRLFVYQIGGSPLTEVIHVRLDGQVAVADSTDVQKVSVEQLTAIVADPRLTF